MVLQVETEEKRLNEDFVWVTKNAFQKKYEGMWVAVVNRKVVGVGKDAKDAYASAKQNQPDKEPLLGFVPKRELLVL